MKEMQYKYTPKDLMGKARDWHDWVEDASYVLAITSCILVNAYIITLICLAIAR